MVKNNNTEQLILETAGNVFLTRGFDGTRMQEIADEAGINKALVHYYFRNKEKLFGAVLNATFREVGARVFEFVNAPVSLEVKIGKIVEAYIEIIKTKPRLPLFVINEVNVNPERILKYLNFHEFFDIAILEQQIRKEMIDGHIIHMDFRQILVSILGMTLFPFAGKPIIQKNLRISDRDWDQFIEDRKKIIPKIIMEGIRNNKLKKNI